MAMRGTDEALGRSRRPAPWLGGALIAALALGLTASAWSNPFVLDDHTKIVANPDLRALDELPSRLIYPYESHRRLERNDPSRPLVFALWTVIYHVFGLDPVPYRVLNALIHALAAALVFVIVRRLLARAALAPTPLGRRGARTPDAADVAAFVAGLFFAVLPIQLGTVIYVYGLSDVLAGALSLAALACFLARPKRGWLLASLACQALAMLAKQGAVAIPLYLAACAWALPSPERLRVRLRAVVPHVGLALLYLAARQLYFGSIGDLEGAGEREPLADYVSGQPLVLLRYLWLTLLPAGLAIDHYLPTGGDPAWVRLLAGAGVLAILGAGACCARRATPRARLLALGVAIYVIALAPTSSLLPTVDPMVERRVYLGNLGVLLVGAVALHALLGVLATRRQALLLLTACAVVAGIYASVALARNRVFASRLDLWQEVLARYPDSPRALNNHATELMARGDHAGAYAEYQRLVALHPHAIPLANLARLHELPDSPYRDADAALAYYRRAIAAGGGPAWIYPNAARLLMARNELDEAEATFLQGLERTPDDAGALNDLGVLYTRREDFAQARRCFAEALRLDPAFTTARDNQERLPADRR